MEDIFLAIQERIKTKIPEIKWTDQDLGQLEFYTERPAVLFPCALIDFDDMTPSDMGNHGQICNTIVKLRVAFNVVHQSSNVTPQPQTMKALEIFKVRKKLHNFLHGWSGDTFGELTRIKLRGEPREDTLRVYEIQYSVSYEEYIEDDELQTIPTPPPTITNDAGIHSDEFNNEFN